MVDDSVQMYDYANILKLKAHMYLMGKNMNK